MSKEYTKSIQRAYKEYTKSIQRLYKARGQNWTKRDNLFGQATGSSARQDSQRTNDDAEACRGKEWSSLKRGMPWHLAEHSFTKNR